MDFPGGRGRNSKELRERILWGRPKLKGLNGVRYLLFIYVDKLLLILILLHFSGNVPSSESGLKHCSSWGMGGSIGEPPSIE